VSHDAQCRTILPSLAPTTTIPTARKHALNITASHTATAIKREGEKPCPNEEEKHAGCKERPKRQPTYNQEGAKAPSRPVARGNGIIFWGSLWQIGEKEKDAAEESKQSIKEKERHNYPNHNIACKKGGQDCDGGPGVSRERGG
jgi:hypothetical protein